jgi:hypothetical protein
MRYSKEPLPVQIIHVLVLVLALQLCTAPIQLIDAFCSVGYPTRKCSSYIQYNNRHCHNMFTPIRNNDIDNNDEDENPIENISTSSMTTTTTTTTTTTNQTNDSSPKQSLDLLKQQQLMEKEQQQKQEQLELEQPIPPMTDPFQATGQNELFKTLAGGPALIFEMARKLVKDSDYNIRTTTSTIQYTTTPLSSETRQQQSQSQSQQRRWYPHSGISDVNPSFRTQSPAMNNQGFCKSIWRNVRKRNKPSLWKLALRTYDRMALLEGDPNFPQIQRSNIHHEGAMQACAKLGLWQRALEIYHYVYQQEMGEIEVINGNINRQQQQPQLEDQQQQKQKQSQSTMTSKNKMQSTLGGGGNNGGKLSTKNNKTNERTKKGSVYVTDDMVLSLVRATVRASRLRSRQKKKSHDPPLSPEQEEREAALRRIPLDTALEILSTLPDDHNIPLVAYYFNPLAGMFWGITTISIYCIVFCVCVCVCVAVLSYFY